MKRGPWQDLLALDRLANALAWGDGAHTLSARCGYALFRDKRWAKIAVPIIEAMPWFGKGHCLRQAVVEGLLRRNPWVEPDAAPDLSTEYIAMDQPTAAALTPPEREHLLTASISARENNASMDFMDAANRHWFVGATPVNNRSTILIQAERGVNIRSAYLDTSTFTPAAAEAAISELDGAIQ